MNKCWWMRLYKWLYILLVLLAINTCSYAQENGAAQHDKANDTTVVTSKEAASTKDTGQNFFNRKTAIDAPYTQNKIGSRVPADTEVNKLRDDDAFWYVKSIEKFKSSSEQVRYDRATRDSLAKKKAGADARRFSEENSFSINIPAWVGKLVWALIIGVFLFAVVYFLMANKINIFSRTSRHIVDMDGQVAAEDLFSLPYHDLLQKAYAEKNYRLAVRILYLQTLKLLSEKNIILFQADYTNMDYLQQLSQTKFYKAFSTITRHYEYVWYGGFAVPEPVFHTIQNDFDAIQNSILHR